MMRAVTVIGLLGLLAACGDNRATPDAAVDAVPPDPVCSAAFTDNFTEAWSGPANCATVATAADHTALQLIIPSRTVSADFAISLDLGSAPGPGTYSSETLITPWSADALHELDMTSCLYHAGTASVPPGSFTLRLDAIGDHAHGTLDLVLYVLARPYTYCGETNVERLTVTF
jgi:hypothetical protein